MYQPGGSTISQSAIKRQKIYWGFKTSATNSPSSSSKVVDFTLNSPLANNPLNKDKRVVLENIIVLGKKRPLRVGHFQRPRIPLEISKKDKDSTQNLKKPLRVQRTGFPKGPSHHPASGPSRRRNSEKSPGLELLFKDTRGREKRV